jgi:hypothetical protein
MKIKNIEGLSADDLKQRVNKGGRFVYFPYTVSLIIVTFRRTSGVYLIHSGESVVAKGFFFTLLTLIMGWWGIPWGPKYTIAAINTNLRGGKDVTDEVMSVVTGYALFEEANRKRK